MPLTELPVGTGHVEVAQGHRCQAVRHALPAIMWSTASFEAPYGLVGAVTEASVSRPSVGSP